MHVQEQFIKYKKRSDGHQAKYTLPSMTQPASWERAQGFRDMMQIRITCTMAHLCSVVTASDMLQQEALGEVRGVRMPWRRQQSRARARQQEQPCDILLHGSTGLASGMEHALQILNPCGMYLRSSCQMLASISW